MNPDRYDGLLGEKTSLLSEISELSDAIGNAERAIAAYNDLGDTFKNLAEAYLEAKEQTAEVRADLSLLQI